MADQKDRHVAGRPEEPEPTGSTGPEPITAAEGAGRRPAAGPEPGPPEAAAPDPETARPAAHHAAPPVPPSAPPPGYHGAPPVPGGPGAPRQSGLRDRARSRPAQLLVAGVVGAIIGGGAVGLLDVLDDGGPEHGGVHMVRYGGPADGDRFGHWRGPMHQDGQMMPGRPGWDRWPGMQPQPVPPSAPEAPPSPTPTP